MTEILQRDNEWWMDEVFGVLLTEEDKPRGTWLHSWDVTTALRRLFATRRQPWNSDIEKAIQARVETTLVGLVEEGEVVEYEVPGNPPPAPHRGLQNGRYYGTSKLDIRKRGVADKEQEEERRRREAREWAMAYAKEYGFAYEPKVNVPLRVVEDWMVLQERKTGL